MADKVGELYAELGIKDLTPEHLDRAERRLKAFHRDTAAMPDVEIGVDSIGFERTLERAEGQYRDSMGRLRDANGRFARAMPPIKMDVDEGHYRDSMGRLRDVHGRFVKEAQQAIVPGFDSRPAIKQAEQGSKDIGKTVAGWARDVAAGAMVVGAVAGAAMVKAFQGYAEREVDTDRLAASLGLNPADQERYGRIAGELYGGAWGDSVADVTRTMRFALNQEIIDPSMTDDQVKAVGSRLMDMSTLYEQDVSRMASAIGTMLKTGMARDVWEAMDILTVGLQGPANKADDLMDTFEEYSTIFRDLGLDGPGALGLLSQAIDGGARNADVAADALKEFALRGKEFSPAIAAAYDALGLDAASMMRDVAGGGDDARGALDKVLDKLREVKDPIERNALAVALFGTKAEDLQDALGSMDVSNATTGLDEVAGAAERATEVANDNIATNLESLKRRTTMAVENWIGSLWEAYDEGGAAGLADKLGADVEKLGDLWDKHGPAIMDKFGAWWQEEGVPIMTDVIKLALETVWDSLWAIYGNMMEGGKDKLAESAAGFWDPIANSFIGMLNGIIEAWNGLELSLPSFDGLKIAGKVVIPGWDSMSLSVPQVPTIPVIEHHTPSSRIPGFAVGLDAGPVPGARGQAMTAVLHGGEVVMTPQQQAQNQAMLDRALTALAQRTVTGGAGTTNIYTADPASWARDALWGRAA